MPEVKATDKIDKNRKKGKGYSGNDEGPKTTTKDSKKPYTTPKSTRSKLMSQADEALAPLASVHPIIGNFETSICYTDGNGRLFL